MSDPNGLPGLPSRLKELRAGWDGVSVSQKHVAEALGVSVALVSSWEKGNAIPPEERLKAYARFFATRRSRSADTGRLIPADDLTPAEENRREQLVDELVRLRERALAPGSPPPSSRGALGGRFWHLPGAQQITVLCTPLSKQQLGFEGDTLPEGAAPALRYAVNQTHPNSIAQLRNGDIDALLELVGHLRAENPSASVNWALSDSITSPDQLSGDVVILGSADPDLGETPFSVRDVRTFGLPVVREFFRLLELPVTVEPQDPVNEFDFRYEVHLDQHGNPRRGAEKREPVTPGFRKDESEPERPRMILDGAPVLDYDVALIARRPNPFNGTYRVTIFCGLFSRGTYGAVRAFTDGELRIRNEQYIIDHLDPNDFWMLVQVPIFLGTRTMTPDLGKAAHRLFMSN